MTDILRHIYPTWTHLLAALHAPTRSNWELKEDNELGASFGGGVKVGLYGVRIVMKSEKEAFTLFGGAFEAGVGLGPRGKGILKAMEEFNKFVEKRPFHHEKDNFGGREIEFGSLRYGLMQSRDVGRAQFDNSEWLSVSIGATAGVAAFDIGLIFLLAKPVSFILNTLDMSNPGIAIIRQILMDTILWGPQGGGTPSLGFEVGASLKRYAMVKLFEGEKDSRILG